MQKENLISTVFILLGLVVLSILISCSEKTSNPDGLIGIYYSEPDLTSIKGISVLMSMEQMWNDSVDYEGGTSGEWDGYIVAPVSGEVVFYVSTNRLVNLKINRADSLDMKAEDSEKRLTVQMEKGKSYPIQIVFYNPGRHKDTGWFNIEWGWEGSKNSPIPLSHLYYTEEESGRLDFLRYSEGTGIDTSQLIYAKGEDVITYYKPGRFAAWPANGGIWSWGDEILVAFTLAYHKENKYHHAINRHKAKVIGLARSLDGGETWILEDTTSMNNGASGSKRNMEKIDFSAEGFALRSTNNMFYYSYDKGKRWQGPFQYPDLGGGQLTARTDYLVENQDKCLIFLSAKDMRVQSPLQDRAMCIKTTDGGLSFEFVSWMSETDSIRSVMPATVRIDQNHLVTAMRRRLDPPKSVKYGLPENWIDVYESYNNGTSWHFLHKIADTDTGIRNGNPPSMVRLKSGLICVIYGYRGLPYGIRARVSDDDGKSWSKEIILRDDANTWDIGYTRSVVREDDKVVSVYYYSNKLHPEGHIEATIWDPNSITDL